MTATLPAGRQLFHPHLLMGHGTDTLFESLAQKAFQAVPVQLLFPFCFPGMIFLRKEILLDLQRCVFFLFSGTFWSLYLFRLFFCSFCLQLIHIVQKFWCQFHFLTAQDDPFFSPVQSIADLQEQFQIVSFLQMKCFRLIG